LLHKSISLNSHQHPISSLKPRNRAATIWECRGLIYQQCGLDRILILLFLNVQHFTLIIFRAMRDQECKSFDCVFETLDGRGAIYISDFASASLKDLRKSNSAPTQDTTSKL
jgi:hypothetical protein